MNQLEAITQWFTDHQVSYDDAVHQLCWICGDCMNDILDDEEQGTQIDFGAIRIETDIARCQIKHLIDGHEYA